ncbi:MAG: nicotinate-nucleotide--dimethylbenzimidazole phosphoribosyltransferase [Dysgonomonas sp.]
MLQFNIEKPQDDVRSYLQDKIDNLTKPKGSLGVLEDLAMQIGWIQQSLNPKLTRPCHIVFAGDHGIAAEGVSPSPQEVTYQMILNFWAGGAGVNFLSRQHGFDLKIVDAGVNFDFKAEDPIINKKIRNSTRNYLHEAAMTREEMELAIKNGAECVQDCFDQGCNVISFGEMGITNTSSSSLWMTYLTGIPLNECIGAGCDHTGNIISHKYKVLKQSMENYDGDNSVEDIIRYFGGYEMVMTVGAMLRAAELKMIILVDGFIMTNCMLAASKLNPNVLHYTIFGHKGDEAGHKLVLEYLKAKPILNLGFRLGEGTGALCAYPIVESAVRMINEMNSFKEIKVTKYF